MPDDDTTIPLGSVHRLSRRQRLVVLLAIGIAAVILFYSVLYWYGVRNLEGRDRTFLQALNVVVETMTTTGYGADSSWSTDVMNVFVVTMQLTGVAIGFFTLRVLVIPLWKRTPIELDERLTPKNDHVVICEYRRDSDVLVDELERLDVEYVLVDSDRDEAKRLSDAGYQTIAGNPENEDVLERASVRSANLVVADAGTRNTSILLSAREMNEDVRVTCLVDSASQREALEQIGADRVISPHHAVGTQLAQLAARPFGPENVDDDEIADVVPLGEDVVLTELLVRRGSSLRGRRLGDSAVGTHPDITVVAGWFHGEFRLWPDRTERLTANTVLVVVGPEATIDGVRDEVAGVWHPSRHSRFVVAGLGESGSAAVESLPERADVTTIDVDDGPDVDVAGDVREPETLRAAGIDEATALLVTIDDDATALLAIALARTMTDDIEIFARVTDAEKVNNAYVAGADYVLSVQRVGARLLASDVHGENTIHPTGQIRSIMVDAGPFAGDPLGAIERDETSGCRIVGVVRDGRFLAGDEVTVRADDEMLLVGTDEAVQAFELEQA